MTRLFCCLLLSAVTLCGADLTGKWSGSFDITNSNGDTQSDTAYMDLKDAAGVVSGTAGPNADKQWPLRSGKLDGQKLTFEVPTDDSGLLTFQLVFDGEAIRGTCTGTGASGERMTAKLDLKRLH